MICLTVLSLLVLYIAGHARMTAVNYQRVQILSQARGLKTQNDLLQSEILRKSDQTAVNAWAKAHGMTLDSRAAFVLSH
jgi:cell division protein FtsL